MKTKYMTLEECVRGPCEGITDINLAGKGIGNIGVKELCKVLLKYKKLKELNFADNNITDEGIIEICNVLPKCEALERLNLRNNSIRYEGVQCILGVLPSLHISMIKIGLGGSIGDDEEKIINNTLQTCTSWKYMKEAYYRPIERQSEHCKHCQEVREAPAEAKEKAEKKAKEEAQKKAKEEAEKKAKEEAERKAKEEAEKISQFTQVYKNLLAAGHISNRELFKICDGPLRESLDVIECVEFSEFFGIRDELNIKEESIEEFKSVIATCKAEIEADDYPIHKPLQIEQLSDIYRLLLAQGRLDKLLNEHFIIASKVLQWQYDNQGAVESARMILENMSQEDKMHSERRAILKILDVYSQSLAKCREAVEEMRRVSVPSGELQNRHDVVLQHGIALVDGLKESVVLLQSRADATTMIRKPVVSDEHLMLCRKIDSSLEEVAHIVSECESIIILKEGEKGRQEFAIALEELKRDYNIKFTEMKQEVAAKKDVVGHAELLKKYKECMGLCEEVLTEAHLVQGWRETGEEGRWQVELLDQIKQSTTDKLFDSLMGLCSCGVGSLPRITTSELHQYVKVSFEFVADVKKRMGGSLAGVHPLLSDDEAAAIHAFTRADRFGVSNMALYTEVNNVLQNKVNRVQTTKYFVPYIALMQKALERFNVYGGVAYRGEKGDFCRAGEKVLYRVSSFTTDIRVSLKEDFFEDGGTLFIVPNFHGYDIRECSDFAEEVEVQTPLLTAFHVADKFKVREWEHRKETYSRHVDPHRVRLLKYPNAWVVVMYRK